MQHLSAVKTLSLLLLAAVANAADEDLGSSPALSPSQATMTDEAPVVAPTTPSNNTTDGLCLMMYQMADNDLEYFIREDLKELIASPLVKEEKIHTSVPAMFFPASTDMEALEDLPETIEGGKRLGGKFAFLTFSIDDATGLPVNNLFFFTTSSSINSVGGNNTLSEHPRMAGGFITPIVYVEAVIDGEAVNVLLGGFGGTVLPWNLETGLQMLQYSAKDYADEFETSDEPVGPIVLDIIAYDFDTFEAEKGTGIDSAAFLCRAFERFLGQTTMAWLCRAASLWVLL